jgi:hypothetical protein
MTTRTATRSTSAIIAVMIDFTLPQSLEIPEVEVTQLQSGVGVDGTMHHRAESVHES